MRKILMVLVMALCAFAAQAQKPDTVRRKSATDSLNRVRDSVTSKPIIPQILSKKNKKKYNPDSTHLPRTAVRRSLFVPGWGQVYNRSYWKVPLIYGGLASFVYNGIVNKKDAKNYLAIYQLKRDPTLPRPKPGDPIYDLYDKLSTVGAQSLADAANGADRNFQLCILGFAGVWAIQAIEAYIQAKFIHSYTMDRDLSFKVTPSIMPMGQTYAYNSLASVMPVVKLTFTLR